MGRYTGCIFKDIGGDVIHAEVMPYVQEMAAYSLETMKRGGLRQHQAFKDLPDGTRIRTTVIDNHLMGGPLVKAYVEHNPKVASVSPDERDDDDKPEYESNPVGPLFYFAYGTSSDPANNSEGVIEGVHPDWELGEIPEVTDFSSKYSSQNSVDWKGKSVTQLLTWYASGGGNEGSMGSRYFYSTPSDVYLFGYGGELLIEADEVIIGGSYYKGNLIFATWDYDEEISFYNGNLDNKIGTYTMPSRSWLSQSFFFNKTGDRGVSLIVDGYMDLVTIVEVSISSNGDSASVSSLGSYDAAQTDRVWGEIDYFWPDHWKNDEGEWPPYPLPSDVTAEYNYPFLINYSPTYHEAMYHEHYYETWLSEKTPIAVDYGPSGGLLYVWHTKRNVYMAEENYDFHGTWNASAGVVGEGRKDTYFRSQECSYAQEGGLLTIEQDDGSDIELDIVTYSDAVAPLQFEGNWDITCTVQGFDYWLHRGDGPPGNGDQEITETQYSSAHWNGTTTVIGTPLYFPYDGIHTPDLSIPDAFFSQWLWPGNMFIDLSANLISYTMFSFSWYIANTRSYPDTEYANSRINYSGYNSLYKITGDYNLWKNGSKIISAQPVYLYENPPIITSGQATDNYVFFGLDDIYHWQRDYTSENGRPVIGSHDDGGVVQEGWAGGFNDASWSLAGSTDQAAQLACSADDSWHFFTEIQSGRFWGVYPPDDGAMLTSSYRHFLGKGVDYKDAEDDTELNPEEIDDRITTWSLIKAYNI